MEDSPGVVCPASRAFGITGSLQISLATARALAYSPPSQFRPASLAVASKDFLSVWHSGSGWRQPKEIHELLVARPRFDFAGKPLAPWLCRAHAGAARSHSRGAGGRRPAGLV